MGIIKDTLKNPGTNQWSRKNLTAVTSLFYAMWYAAHGLIFCGEVLEFVVFGFLGLAGGMLGVSSWEKFNINKKQDGKTIT